MWSSACQCVISLWNFKVTIRVSQYLPKYYIGDRVFGHWNKIPFVGTVGNDTLIDETVGPRVSVHLDLPIQDGDIQRSILFVKHKDIKMLKVLD